MTFRFRKLAAQLLAGACFAAPLAAIPQPSVSAPLQPAIPARVLSIYPNAAQICGPIQGGARNPVIEQQIQNFNRVMNLSQTGRDLIGTAARYDSNPAWMCFENIKGLHAVYYIGKGVITVGMNKTNDEIVSDSAHELRHLFQEKARGADIEPRDREDSVHLEYVDEADAEATSSLVLWELKQAGHAGPWNSHNSPYSYGPRSICYAHISTAFKQAVDGGATLPEATRAAFRAWYKDPDLLQYYRPETPSGDEKRTAQGISVQARTIAASSCSDANPARQTRGYEIPSDYISDHISRTVGNLPSYNINYIQQGGGLKNILQGP